MARHQVLCIVLATVFIVMGKVNSHVYFGMPPSALRPAVDAASIAQALQLSLPCQPGVLAPGSSVFGRPTNLLQPLPRSDRNQMRRFVTEQALLRRETPIRVQYDTVISCGAALAHLIDTVRQRHSLATGPSHEWLDIVAEAAIKFWSEDSDPEPVRSCSQHIANWSEYGEWTVELLGERSRQLMTAINDLFEKVIESGLRLSMDCELELARTQIRLDLVQCRLHEQHISDVRAVQIFEQYGVETGLLDSFPILQLTP